jgi:ABC-2 type transport system permease protein
MNKTWAVFKREYLQAVKKKMFIIMTFLMPFFMILLFAIPTLMMTKGAGVRKVVVLDGTGQLRDAFTKAPAPAEGDEGQDSRQELPQKLDIEYVDARNQNIENGAKPYLARLTQENNDNRLDGVLLVPADALADSGTHLKYYSRSATDLAQEGLARRASRTAQHYRLAARGLDPKEIDKLIADFDVDAIQLSKSGEEKKGGAENLLVGFMLTGLLLLPSFIYGLEIMRGIVQEKTDRVVEVLVSSMSPSQLLVGKVLGIAAVGLTQISVWMIMAGSVAAVQGTIAAMAGENFLQLLRPMVFVYFAIFFLLAYLTYVCIYAIGGAICNTEKEAQQLIGPFSMIMMLPWFLMVGIITNPDSALSVGFSLAPVWGPMTMYVRTLVAEPPVWHVLLSIAISIATIAAFFWITIKIFRVGILSYGKRPTLPELWRWIKVA